MDCKTHRRSYVAPIKHFLNEASFQKKGGFSLHGNLILGGTLSMFSGGDSHDEFCGLCGFYHQKIGTRPLRGHQVLRPLLLQALRLQALRLQALRLQAPLLRSPMKAGSTN